MGDSAAIRVLRFLNELSPLGDKAFFESLFRSTHIGGAGIGIAGSDDASKDLTCNLGIVSISDGRARLLFNVRYPVTWTGELLETKCKSGLPEGFALDEMSDSPPLYFPLDHPLVATIVDVYEAETGERKAPGTMGGGTYARAVPNTVSIGTGWQGDGPAHETDERLKIDHLFQMSRIYAHIFYRLALEATKSPE
jgi:succinyl-diaminopimelate desuccinylase